MAVLNDPMLQIGGLVLAAALLILTVFLWARLAASRRHAEVAAQPAPPSPHGRTIANLEQRVGGLELKVEELRRRMPATPASVDGGRRDRPLEQRSSSTTDAQEPGWQNPYRPIKVDPAPPDQGTPERRGDPRPWSPPVGEAESFANPPAPPAPPREHRVSQRLLDDYHAAAEDLSEAGERFMNTYLPEGVARAGEDGYRREGDARAATLWLVQDGSQALLLPGYRALRNWSGHFLPSRDSHAAEHFGEAFELDASSTRFDAAPAFVTESGGRIVLERRGRITGFRT